MIVRERPQHVPKDRANADKLAAERLGSKVQMRTTTGQPKSNIATTSDQPGKSLHSIDFPLRLHGLDN